VTFEGIQQQRGGTFRDIFGLSIGKENSATIFLVDFLRLSKWQNQIFQKKKIKIFSGKDP
jgi:hypothetical protein